MNTAALVDAIVERMKEKAGDFPTRRYPNNPSKAKMMASAKGEYLIRYVGSNRQPAKRQRNGSILQNCEAQIEVTIRNRSLEPLPLNKGVYKMLDDVNGGLTKWTPPVPGATFLLPVRDGFVDEDEGVWEHAAFFAFTYPEVTL